MTRLAALGRSLGSLLVVLAASAAASCSPPPKAREVQPIVVDVPAILRGTIGSEVSVRGAEPVLVSGYGLVVGLNGTGGGALPVQIQSTMERELARGGIGRGGPLDTGPFAGKTPRQVLRDPNVAVVIVEGVVPPGAPEGYRFDVRVRTLPGSAVTSLEGGTLWTTELRLGPVTTFGQVRTLRLAEARGPVFINPFAEPGVTDTDLAERLARSEAAQRDAAFEADRARAAGTARDAEPFAERPEDASPEAGAETAEGMGGGASALPAPAVAITNEADAAAGRAADDDGGIRASSGRGAVPLRPAAVVRDAVTRTVGRVLDGGSVTDPLRIELVLNNPGHARAASIVTAINSRFPERSNEGATARGRSASSIAMTVPAQFRDDPSEFLLLLRFTQIDQAFPQEYAQRYADELLEQPALADELSWCLQALGKPATPFLARLYEAPEFLPRLAALRAGSRLGDPRATPYVIDLARQRSAPVALRSEAIEMLGRQGPDPRIGAALRELVDDPQTELRIAAYEALAQRGDPAIQRRLVEGKFELDILPARSEMIYITQAGTPRIVLFGDDLRLRGEVLVSAWSDRLLLKPEDEEDRARRASYDALGPGVTEGGGWRLYYRDYRTDRALTARVGASLRELIRFMARRPTPENPEPGLDLSYSEVVGAIYEIQRQGALGRGPESAAFTTQRDRFIARLLEAQDLALLEERPESDEGAQRRQDNVVPEPAAKPMTSLPATPVRRSLVVPLSPPGGTGQPPPGPGRGGAPERDGPAEGSLRGG